MEKNYNWNRLFCKEEDKYDVDFSGFLIPPVKGETKLYSQNECVKRFDELIKFQALTILGEPGMGKSNVLKSIYENECEASESKTEHLYFNLSSFSTELYLDSKIFQDERVLNWKKSKGDKLYLYFDSIDECLIRIDSLASLISEKLKEFPCDRLYIRLASRFTVWPRLLRDTLNELYEDLYSQMELLPLSKDDIVLACKANEIDPTEFLKEAEDKNANSFLIKPVTLEFNINYFKENGALPKTQFDVYKIGCDFLSKEHSQSRESSRMIQNISIKDKLEFAEYVSFLALFSNRTSISLEEDTPRKEDVLYLSDFNLSSIKDYTDTGLFSPRGDHYVGWSHKTYWEFLASRYLINRKVSLQKLKQLTFIRNEIEVKVVPQLQEVAKWVALEVDEYFFYLIDHDPETLLLSDLSVLDETRREQVLVGLVNSLKRNKTKLDYKFIIRVNWKNLNYSGLGEKLDEYIDPKDLDGDIFYIFSEIIRSCEVMSLKPKMMEIIRNDSNPSTVREDALTAVKDYLEVKDYNQLKDLLKHITNDSADHLKGKLLSILWPRYLSCTELFDLLDKPKKDNYYGNYKSFIQNELVIELKDDCILPALKWAQKVYTPHSAYSTFNDILGSICEKAWGHLATEEVLIELGNLIYSYLKHHDSINNSYNRSFFQKFRSDYRLRRKIFKKLIDTREDLNAWEIVGHDTGLVDEKDFEYILDLAKLEVSGRKTFLMNVADYLLHFNRPSQTDYLFRVAKEDEEIKARFIEVVGPVELGSDLAKEMKKGFENRKRYQKKEKKNYKAEIEDQLIQAVLMVDEDIESSFYRGLFAMARDCMSKQIQPERRLQESFLWKDFNPYEREEFINLFFSFFKKIEPKAFKRYKKENSISFHSMINVGFLNLVFEEYGELFGEAPSSFWEKWLGDIMVANSFGNQNLYLGLLQFVIDEVGDLFYQNLIVLIKAESRTHQHSFLLDKYKAFLNDELCNELVVLIKGEAFSDLFALDVLERILKYKYSDESARLLFTFLPYFKKRAASYEIEVKASLIVISLGTRKDLKRLWIRINKNPELGHEIIESLHVMWDGLKFLNKLDYVDLKGLFLWIMKMYPFEENKRQTNGEINKVVEFRDGLMRHTINRGSVESCKIISEIASQYPEHQSLQWSLESAKREMRQKSWQPMDPEVLNDFTKEPNKKVIQNGFDLLEIVVDSINNIQERLKGENVLVQTMWNTNKGAFVPKSEDEISDIFIELLKDELNRKQVILNREVVIRRSYGAGTGQRSDIKIEAILKDSSKNWDQVALIVEAKGVWNNEVLTNLKSQLVDKYLKNNTPYGVFLVFDPFCEIWNGLNDKRKQHCEKNLRGDNLMALLKQQAEDELSNGYYVRPHIVDVKIDH